jgi:NAD(P)-dependent dehydrogenase (short-subunit alcohol dehydrogenase family)
MFDFSGKVAIVTGGGRGIGPAIAVGFADAGADVTVTSRTKSELDKVVRDIEKAGRKGLAVAADIGKAKEVQKVVDATVDKFGKVDILVNNAGFFPYNLFLDITEEDWDRVQDTNIKGQFLMAQAAARQMVKQGNGGKIVNIASVEGEFPITAGRTHYHASKGAIINFTRGLAKEMAQYNINVNAVAPGLTDTPGAQSMTGGYSLDSFGERIPLGRLGKPEDIAPPVLFMASDAARYITGFTLFVEGGMLLGRGWKRIG